MKDLSLNLLDIAENSVKAGATLTQLLLTQEAGILTFQVVDDGCGMTEEVLRGVVDPFYTTRTTRKVGMGLPLLRMAAEQTGGTMTVESRHKDAYPDNHGTVVTAGNRHHPDSGSPRYGFLLPPRLRRDGGRIGYPSAA